LNKQELRPAVPDLRVLPVERLARLGDSVLAHSIALYNQRLNEAYVLPSSFNSHI
jgi:hypothetical protein